MKIRSTTILAVRRDGRLAIAGDGQVTLGQTVVKHGARKVRKISGGRVLAGFAGSAADGITLLEKFEAKFAEFKDLRRAAVELAKDWRQDRVLRRLEALMIVGNPDHLFVLSGTGDVIEPDEGVAAIGSGGPYAQAAADGAAGQHGAGRRRDRAQRLGDRGEHLHLHQHRHHRGEPSVTSLPAIELDPTKLTPRQIVEELDKYIVGQGKAKRAVAIALRNRYRRARAREDLRDEITPKNILMIGPTGVGKTEIARRLAALVGAPFVKVEATKYTEVGYVGRDVESMVRDLVEASIRTVTEERRIEVRDLANRHAVERVIDALHPETRPPSAQGQNNAFGQALGSIFGNNFARSTAAASRSVGGGLARRTARARPNARRD